MSRIIPRTDAVNFGSERECERVITTLGAVADGINYVIVPIMVKKPATKGKNPKGKKPKGKPKLVERFTPIFFIRTSQVHLGRMLNDRGFQIIS